MAALVNPGRITIGDDVMGGGGSEGEKCFKSVQTLSQSCATCYWLRARPKLWARGRGVSCDVMPIALGERQKKYNKWMFRRAAKKKYKLSSLLEFWWMPLMLWKILKRGLTRGNTATPLAFHVAKRDPLNAFREIPRQGRRAISITLTMAATIFPIKK